MREPSRRVKPMPVSYRHIAGVNLERLAVLVGEAVHRPPYMMSCQSAWAWFISSAKRVTSVSGTCGSSAPWQTSTFALTVPGGADSVVARLPWMLTMPARSAPERANVRTAGPPKQKPIAATGPPVFGQLARAARPACARRDRGAQVVYSAAVCSCRTPKCSSSGSGLARIDAADLVSAHLQAPVDGNLSPCVVAVSGEQTEPILFFALDVNVPVNGEDLAVDPVAE